MIALVALILAQSPPARLLTLEHAQRIALEHQPQLMAARSSTQAAEGRVEQSRSGLLPQLLAISTWERTTENYTFRPGSRNVLNAFPNSWDNTSYWANAAALSQLLWDFGVTSKRWRATQASARSTADQERATRQLVIFQLRTTFFNAVAAKELLEVARETLANQHNHFVQIEGFVGAGTRPPIDLSQARADLANAEVQVINADNAYQRAKILLNQAMGVEGLIDYEVAKEGLPPQEGEDGALEPLLDRAITARPEIASATEQVKAQELLIQSARGSYAPSISAVGTVAEATAAGSKHTGWNVAGGVTLTWNLFQGGLTTGMVHEADGNRGFAAAQLELLRQQVRVDVDNARLAVRAGKAALASAVDALRAARQRLSLAEGRYQNGSGSVIELGDAQIYASNFAAQVVQTEFQLMSARAQLLWAIGQPVKR